MKKHLTTVEKIKNDTRFVSSHIEAIRIEPLIKESEQINIKNQIGDALFLDLLSYVEAEDKSSFPDYSILLNGGTYEDKCNDTRSLNGLIETLNYYVFARMIKINDFVMTRTGYKVKQDQHSDRPDLKDRLAQEKDALSIADSYMTECLLYLKNNRSKFPKFKKGKQRNRIVGRIIGN